MTPRRRTAVAAATLGCTALLGGLVAVPAQAEPAPGAAPAPAAGAYLAPWYTELDLTGDRQVTPDDLELVATALGAVAGTPRYEAVAVADVDADGAITVADLAAVSQRQVYDDGPFQLVEATAIDMQAAMNAGVTTSVAITQEYLDRIAAYDRTTVDPAEGGRPLASIVTTSAVALEAAAAADATRAERGMTSPLLGVPLAVKDNYDTVDMPTTAGCSCWDANQTDTDATMVAGLRAEGAVVLAKASLDEFAFGFVSQFSSHQPVGSSTFVASPYATSRTAGGSSGGTGAAIAANLAGIGFGTDTGGSIRVPSSYNQLVGIRPTVGLASREGIVPLALSQDTGGPMARTVADAAVALDAVVAADPADATTQQPGRTVPESYASSLDPEALAGRRFGYVASMVGTGATNQRLFAEAVADLRAAGAEVVEVAPPAGFDRVLSEGSGSTAEFRHDLAQYVQAHLAPDVAARSLGDIVASGQHVPSRRDTYLTRAAVTEEQYQAWAGPTGSHTIQLAAGQRLVTAMLDGSTPAGRLDALLYPSGSPYGTVSTNLRLGPNTGMPSISVPMGQADQALDGAGVEQGAGVNLEFLGRDWSEGDLVGIGYAFEQATGHRTAPALYGPLP
ncbi:amidase family protein [Frigoribacterium salinisoli]